MGTERQPRVRLHGLFSWKRYQRRVYDPHQSHRNYQAESQLGRVHTDRNGVRLRSKRKSAVFLSRPGYERQTDSSGAISPSWAAGRFPFLRPAPLTSEGKGVRITNRFCPIANFDDFIGKAIEFFAG